MPGSMGRVKVVGAGVVGVRVLGLARWRLREVFPAGRDVVMCQWFSPVWK